ncbi:hypothetical protein GCM10008908_05310 [Clostridium subterminale]|uniref:Uncharacterized protein n=1 Tax=Clostridium subterminale TaxID=1550 RepID=A0ABN1KHE7_CLOSU
MKLTYFSNKLSLRDDIIKFLNFFKFTKINLYIFTIFSYNIIYKLKINRIGGVNIDIFYAYYK